MQLGAYSLAERIGSGRLAQVYRARDAGGQPVAIKLLAPDAELDDPAARDRFHREIHMLSQVRHPNVLALLGHGVDPELGPYLVTPLVEGRTLREVMVASGPVPPEVALLGAREIAAGIAAIHAAGVIHRDLKPENVMLRPDGSLVVIDLGLAYRADQTRYTEEGAVAGSVPYMAPEQIEATALSAATDVWALGVILYEWIAGRRPFARSRHSEEVAAILSGRFTPASEHNGCVAASVDALIAACLTSSPPQRISDAGRLVAAIEACMDWPGARDQARPALGDTTRYAEEIARYRAESLAEEARGRIAQGEIFVATRLLERGLAYRPNDPTLLALVDHAASAPEPRARPIWPLLVGSIGIMVVAVVLSAWLLGGDGPLPTTADDPAAQAAKTPPTNEAGLPALDPATLSNSDPVLRGALKLYLPGLVEGLYPQRLFKGNPYTWTIHTAAGLKKLAGANDRLMLAKAYLATHSKVKGLQLLEQLSTDYPNRSDIWAFRGYIETRRGNWQKADELFTRAVEVDAKNAYAWRQRGNLRRRLGRTRDGYADLVKSLALDPDNVYTMRWLGFIYRKVGRAADTRMMFDRALKLAPKDKDVLIDAALANEGDRARELMAQAWEMDRTYARVIKDYCMLLARQKHPLARPRCASATLSLSTDVDVALAAGYAALRENRISEASSHFITAQVRGPKDWRGPWARARLNMHIHSSWFLLEPHLQKACDLGHEPACTKLKQHSKNQSPTKRPN